MKEEGCEHDHDGNTHLSANRAGSGCKSEGDQCRLSHDGIVLVAITDQDVDAHQSNQGATELWRVNPAPMVCIYRQPIEEFHGDDNPRNPENMHTSIGNPALS